MGKSILKLNKRLKSLEKELAKVIITLGDQAVAESTNEAKEFAHFEALLTVVQELTLHEGISREEFLKHYDSLYQHSLDQYLQKLEETSPGFAAEIDKRTIAEIELTESSTPLFPPPEDES